MPRPLLFAIALSAFVFHPSAFAADAKFKKVKVTDEVFHLGDSKKSDWKKFTSEEPHAENRLELEFEAKRNKKEHVLRIVSGEVNSSWYVRVNDKRLEKLEKGKKGKGERTQYIRVPAGLLKDGRNWFVVERDTKGSDDIWFGPVTLEARSLESAKKKAKLEILVRDAATGKGLPSRITVTRTRSGGDEALVDLKLDKNDRIATRKGVVYTLDGRAEVKLAAGRYRVYATRGFEYGLGRVEVDLSADETRRVAMTLEREVDTTGYLAGDTHIHTVTYSKHGDATVEERVVTIVGEGVEVAIATDHNHHTDYRKTQNKVDAPASFRSIIGNEFTTPVGHFNAFPIEKGAKPAKHDHKSWVRLLRGLRETPGVRVVICNHPRRPSYEKGPWGKMGLHEISGEFANPAKAPPSDVPGEEGEAGWIGLDAVEVLNGKGLLEDPELNFRDWFTLLNRGYRLAAVAGSDSHTVDQPVGQSRTYVRSSTDDPDRIDVKEVVESFREGRLLVSMGLLARAKVDRRFEVGDLATGLGEDIDVEVEVSAPRWIRADLVTLYLNGRKVREEKIAHGPDDIVKYRKTWKLGRPHRDAHLVVIATGPPIEGRYWAFEEDDRYVIGATNPIWIDGDGDGEFTSARGYASRLLAEHGTDGSGLRQALRTYDETVAVQAASLVRRRLELALQKLYDQLQARANDELQEIFPKARVKAGGRLAEYLEGAPPIDVTTARERQESEDGNKAKKGKTKRKKKK